MPQEPLEVLVFDPVCVLALHRLPGVLVEPGAAKDVERLACGKKEKKSTGVKKELVI